MVTRLAKIIASATSTTGCDRSVPEWMPNNGPIDAPIIVICDAPKIALWNNTSPIGGDSLNLWAAYAKRYGFNEDDFAFLSPCAPIPDEIEGVDRREKEFIDQYRDALLKTLHGYHNARLIIYTGKAAGYAITGKPVKIMRQRGVVRTIEGLGTLLPMLSPNHVLRRPEVKDLFDADFNMLRILADNDFRADAVASSVADAVYEWRDDISEFLINPPSMISFDTEGATKAGTGPDVSALRWYRPEVTPLTFQFSWEQGRAIVCPLDRDYYPDIGRRQLIKLKGQIKELLANPAVKKFGHNIKYDYHIMKERLGMEVEGMGGDTQLLAFFVDENMFEKSLSECVRRWVPEMAGYSDAFDRTYDKNNMRDVPHDEICQYGGGDADATLRVVQRLIPLIRADKKQWNCCQRIQWPATKAFAKIVEPQGIRIDTTALRSFFEELKVSSATKYKELIAKVPAAVKRKHAEAGQGGKSGLEFSRDAFVIDILFSKDGFNLKPVVWTDSTKKLKDVSKRVPSVSTKTHLPYFDDNEFVVKLIDYKKITKLQTTYVGQEFDKAKGGPTGFWQYIYNDRIHPSYLLHRTVTGRTASSDPNGQNIPKHGALAKAYRKIFIPSEGYTLIEVDLSQAELRLVAWMAEEPTMLKVYRAGGDIHAMTAAMIMGITLEQFMTLDKDTKKKKRQEAKAVNFGLIYGMSWRKLITYAKTTYNVVFTEEQAKRIHALFFRTYARLQSWHKGMRNFVKEHGYVRAMHGAVRHLPNINSIDEIIVGECERQAINSPIQRFGSDIGVAAMQRMCRDAPIELMRPVAFIHDALIIEARLDYVDQALSAAKFYMESTPFQQWFNARPILPITADVSIGHNLSAMEERPDVQSIAPDWWNMEADGYETEEQAYAYAQLR